MRKNEIIPSISGPATGVSPVWKHRFKYIAFLFAYCFLTTNFNKLKTLRILILKILLKEKLHLQTIHRIEPKYQTKVRPCKIVWLNFFYFIYLSIFKSFLILSKNVLVLGKVASSIVFVCLIENLQGIVFYMSLANHRITYHLVSFQLSLCLFVV